MRAFTSAFRKDDGAFDLPHCTRVMSDPTALLDRLVAKASRLYSLPAVAMQVLELTNNPRVDVHALKQCIENDPALTTKVLRVVNSSLFGLSRQVSDLNQALALLGIKPLKLLVLGFSLPERLFDGVAAGILERYWRHTLTKAVAAREISETLWQRPGDEAFIAGLLQDLGILLLIQELGAPYVRFLEKMYAQGGDLPALETDVMGFDHTMLSSRLLDHWGLPDALVEAVCRQTAIEDDLSASSSQQPLHRILHLAELLSQLLADGRADVLGQLLALGQQWHEVSAERLEALVDELEEKVKQLANVLSLRLPEGRDYREVLAQAHAQLAEVAAEAAEDLIRQQSAQAILETEGHPLLDEIEALSQAVAQASLTVSEPTAAPPAGSPMAEPVALGAVPGSVVGLPARSAPTDPHLASAGRPAAAEADPGLLGQLAASVSACRKSHRPLTLLLVELDDVEDLMITGGLEGFGRVRNRLEAACQAVDHPYPICLPHRDTGFAVILPDCERQRAVQLANQLIGQFRRLAPGRSALSLSVGAATVSVPSKNFPPEDLLNGAERCLYGSHASGGGVVKSIEIY